MNSIYEVKPTDWINVQNLKARLGAHHSNKPPNEYDPLVSRVVGKPIRKTDPILLKFVVEKSRHLSEEQQDHFLEIPSVVQELKNLFK